MSTTTFLAFAAPAYGTVLSIAPLLQVRLIVRNRSSAGVSAGYALILVTAMLLWMAYGISISSVPIIVPNVVAVVVGSLNLAVIWRYRPRPQHAPASQAPGDRDATALAA